MKLYKIIEDFFSCVKNFYKPKNKEGIEETLRGKGYKQHSVHKDIWYDSEKGEYYRNINGEIEKINPSFFVKG